MPSSDPLVSILTPVYNEAAYVRECIESVLAQTYRHWEHTIVDNASTDGTGEIAREYAAKDDRIRVIRNDETLPVEANHSLAFEQVSGAAKYAKVVAGDDWIYPKCLEEMVRLAESHPRVAIVGAYSQSGIRVDPAEFPFEAEVVSGHELARCYLARGPHLVGAPTPLLFRADAVRARRPFYRSAKPHHDADACLSLLANDDYGFVRQVLTYTRVREGSLTGKLNRYNVYMPAILELLIEHGPNFFEPAELDARIRDQLTYYYNELGRSLVRRRGSDFWDYHRKRLAELGHPLSWARVAVNAILYAAEAVVTRTRKKV
ncbi:MAG TPA: glycosyltransferase family 2 protein [Myxococcota bacterium]|nr:glycosyltransferase family 2 protein [Myxococcota bacterium]